MSKLLVLSALWLGMASSAKAVVPESSWTIPEPPGIEQGYINLSDVQATVDDESARYYLYNPTSHMFFASGNDWSTRASIASFGYEVWFTTSDEADAEGDNPYTAPENGYYFWDNCQHPDRVLGDKNLFTDDGGATWVDRASQANYTWVLTEVNGFVRIQNDALIWDKPEFAGKYLGWKGDYSDSRLYMIADTEGTVDWKFVSAEWYETFKADEEAYNAYVNGFELYNLAADLRKVLVEGDAINAAIADQIAVYTNTASTKADLQAAITAAEAAIAKRKAEMVDENYDNATVANPVVVTDKFLKNYDFVGNKYDYWLGSGFGEYGGKDNAERYAMTYDTYQDVNGGMKAGVYAVGVKAFYRAGNSQPAYDNWKANNAQSKYAKLYGRVGKVDREVAIVSPCIALLTEAAGVGSESAVTGTDGEGNEVTYYIPNNMVAAEHYMHVLGLYDNKVLVAVMSETDTLRVGVRKSVTIDGDWSLFDDFSLTYYGKGSDACQLYLTEALKNYGDYTPEEGTLYTPSYLTAYKQLIEGEMTANSLEEVNTILDGIDVAYKALQTNMDSWKNYQKVVEKGKATLADPVYEPIADDSEEMGLLSDYIEMDDGVKAILAAMALTNEELEAEIAKIEGWMKAIAEQSKNAVKDGEDVTRFITNPGFDDDKDIDYSGAEGWTVDRVSGGNVVRGPLGQGNLDLMTGALGEMNYCFESWHCHKWDIWQELTDLPRGMYELQVQGYVRCEVGGYNRGDDINPDYPSPVYLYMNNAMSQFPSVYSEIPSETGNTFTTVESWTTEEINGELYPNSMGGAAQCFKWGMYKTTAWGLIAQKGDKFRIGVKMDADQDWWCIFDSFKLIYHTATIENVKPLLEERIKELDLSRPMGKDVYARAEALQNVVNNATSVDQMFEALDQTYTLQADIITSVALFASLDKANEAFNDAIVESENDAAKTEATALYDRIAAGIQNHEFEDAEVEGLLEQIDVLKVKLGFPNGWENASDAAPADFTGVITNPDYDEDNSGWSGTASSSPTEGVVEIFGKNFDYYQDIKGLPAGTWRVTVQGFYRAGGATEDYAAWIATPDSLNYAEIYGASMVEGDTAIFARPVKRLGAEAWAEAEIGMMDGYVYAQNPSEEGAEDGFIVPNSMAAASSEFNDYEKYQPGNGFNEAVIQLAEGATLRIGLRKETEVSNNWTIWDNWHLYYHGKASSLTSIQNVADNAPVVMVEFYTLDGRKATAAQKGIILKKVTLQDGSVVVKKLRK